MPIPRAEESHREWCECDLVKHKHSISYNEWVEEFRPRKKGK